MRRRYRKPNPKQVSGGDAFFKPRIQKKLKMGQPGDKYEVEADQMADQVVNKGNGESVQRKEGEEEVQQKPLAENVSPLIQKMEGEEEPVQAMEEEDEAVQSKEEEESVQAMEEEESMQAKEEEEAVQSKEEEESVQAMEEEEAVQSKEEESVQAMEEEEAVQTKSNNTKPKNEGIENKLRKGSGGSKMDPETQAEMESGFGADFSNVNIHDDSEAAQMSQDIGAKAFTHGNDIYFNNGKYDPNSKEGKHLLAHELTHTIQQGSSSSTLQADFATEAIDDNPTIAKLKEDEIKSAIKYNSRRIKSVEEIKLLRDVLGLSQEPAVFDKDFIEAIVSYQARNAIGQDGKIGPITASRISKELWAEARFLGKKDGKQLRRMARRMDNRSFNITVTRAAGSLSTRGSAEYGVQWSVPDKMANGWIIQHVKFEADITDAAGNPVGSNNGGIEYWEGWEVKNGEVYVGRASGGSKHRQDTFRSIDENAGTKGQVRILGTVRFIPGYNLKTPPWGYTVPQAGSLPTMTSKPGVWVEGGARKHNLIVNYDATTVPETQTINSRP
ncbi:MAG: DUF4157 domain-containing protein [Flavobacteriaceae bacterium]|nr:DUF4157 domain-containing protein [Flavobacteriaceae bacterium]